MTTGHPRTCLTVFLKPLAVNKYRYMQGKFLPVCPSHYMSDLISVDLIFHCLVGCGITSSGCCLYMTLQSIIRIYFFVDRMHESDHVSATLRWCSNRHINLPYTNWDFYHFCLITLWNSSLMTYAAVWLLWCLFLYVFYVYTVCILKFRSVLSYNGSLNWPRAWKDWQVFIACAWHYCSSSFTSFVLNFVR